MKDLRREVITLKFAIRNFYVNKPRFIDIELTNKCNLKCKECWFWGESGIGDRYSTSELSTHEVYALIDEIATYKPSFIYIGGGEPFIRNDLLNILEYIKDRGLVVGLTTNGTLLNRNSIERIVELEIDSITFSIDGDERLHDHRRGNGTFKKAIENLKNLLKSREKKGSEKPYVMTNTVIRNEMIGHLKEAFIAIYSVTNGKVDCYNFQHLWYITEDELYEHQIAVKKILGVEALSAKCHLIPSFSRFDILTLAQEIIYLKRFSKVRFFPDLSISQLSKYYSREKMSRRCIAPFFALLIKPNGDVVFCPDEWISEYVLGNIRKEGLLHIWNNDMARKFRAAVFRHGPFPCCKRCCWNYLF